MVVDYGYYGGQCGFTLAFIVLDTQMETFMDTRKGSEKFMNKNTFSKLMIFQVDLAKADTLLIEDEYKKDYKRYYTAALLQKARLLRELGVLHFYCNLV